MAELTSHSTFSVIKIVVAALLCFPGLGICQSSASQTTVSGIVVNADDLQPVPGATIIITVEPPIPTAPEPTGATTGPDGRFNIPNIATSQYRIHCQKQGFVTLSHLISRAGANGEPINSGSGSLELRMTPQAAVAGQVTDSNGQPLANATVRLSRVQLQGRKTALSVVTQISTNDLGQYRIFGVEPGRYYVSASFQDAGAALGLRLKPTPDGVVTEDYAVVYYPGVSDVESATVVRLRGGKAASNIDMRIGMARSFAVSGVVAGLPPDSPSPEIFLQPSDPASLGPVRIYVPPSGTNQFRFKSVPPGSYALTASVNLRGQIFSARQEISVTSVMSGVALDLQSPFSLVGVIAGESGAKLPTNLKVRLHASSNPRQADLKLEQDGRFQVPGIGPDDYSISVTDETGKMFVRSLFLNDRQIQSGSVTIPGPDYQLRLVVSEKAGRIKGVAVDGNQHPVSRGLVVLVGEEFENSQVYASPLDIEGAFKFQSLPPGRYRIRCFSDLSGAEDATWDVQKKVKTEGKSISIAENDTQQLRLETTQLDPL